VNFDTRYAAEEGQQVGHWLLINFLLPQEPEEVVETFWNSAKFIDFLEFPTYNGQIQGPLHQVCSGELYRVGIDIFIVESLVAALRQRDHDISIARWVRIAAYCARTGRPGDPTDQTFPSGLLKLLWKKHG
jgi:hypothetical protein